MRDPRDNILQTLTPTLMVPKFGNFDPLSTPGHRFLVASDGLWLEIKRAWLYARVSIASSSPSVPIPYGAIAQVIDLKFGKLPVTLRNQFVELAKADLPNESAAAIIWNERTDVMRLQPLGAVRAGPGHIIFNQPVLAADEHLIVDLHSHGSMGAFFSRTDNKDDRTAVKVSGVVGNLDQNEQTFAFRLCALGTFISL